MNYPNNLIPFPIERTKNLKKILETGPYMNTDKIPDCWDPYIPPDLNETFDHADLPMSVK